MITLGQNTSITNSVTVTVSQSVPVGWLVVAAVGNGGADLFTVSDSRSNVWSDAVQRPAGGGRTSSAVAGISFTVLTHALSAGDTIVATFSGGTSVQGALSVVASPDFGSLDTFGAAQSQDRVATFTVSTSANLSSPTELVIGAAATGCADTPLDFTLSGGFSQLQSWSVAGASGVLGQLSGSALSGKPAFGATASAGQCTYVAAIAAFEPGAPRSPTALSLSHTPNAKSYSVSFTAGRGNGGPGGCSVQYQQTNGVWRSDTSVDCDSNASGVSGTLPNTTRLTPWTSAPVRLIRISDNAVLGQFPQALTCSPKAGSSVSTPTVDEDCDGTWDNTTCTTFNWVYQNTYASNFTACTNSQGTASSYACTAATQGEKRYTDGLSQALTPTQVWSSDQVGTGCQGSYTGAVEWLCVPSNCTYH